ncbi:hypothetical protein DIU31_016360 [Mucilaginibacter rubeus]|uniref:Uncharacterized protein n=1 Tax=Mucilaginibacter rubeus TaxID=2027860 RepID=A0AAE6JHS0_9SPHI|nr:MULTISPECIES: hypothetical protein [Mucilaginibacter]QEM05012.1 hypothetical protein DIU31_016360 [Mucilaginibacter rubeus]QEM17606.1 hypothetical protein DIU38_016525 [Mucilaginibacter gossypii]QTE45873.1 hypothetical protein J3L19_11160 [Mucilaginibacter rubeus]QTE52470.1 hypothetical protein J3L21_11130 [Mucilaginibacter rubeus]QTE57559.1 hypothetical protein J3L23_02805 [Mucilaginibacter rubeus]
MGLLNFFAKLLGLGRRFSGTPEQYLAMVQYMAEKNNPDYSKEELLQWGEVMQKVMKVNLQPYQDFKDLAENGTPDDSMVEKVDGKVKEIEQRRDLKQAIYGPNADLGDDDVMKSNDSGAVFARKMVKDLAEHVQFSDEEQKKLDEL